MRFRVDNGTGTHTSPVGWIDIYDPALVEVLKHYALVPRLIKKTPGSEYTVDHFDLIERERVDTRPLEEII